MDLNKEFQQLLHIVSDYHSGKPERITDVLYSWWKVYYLINSKLKETQVFSEKEAIINQFVKFSKNLNEIYDQFQGTRLLGNENSEDVDPDNRELPLVVSNLLKMLYMERDQLSNTMKALKKEKNGINRNKKIKISSGRIKRKNWIPE